MLVGLTVSRHSSLRLPRAEFCIPSIRYRHTSQGTKRVNVASMHRTGVLLSYVVDVVAAGDGGQKVESTTELRFRLSE